MKRSGVVIKKERNRERERKREGTRKKKRKSESFTIDVSEKLVRRAFLCASAADDAFLITQ